MSTIQSRLGWVSQPRRPPEGFGHKIQLSSFDNFRGFPATGYDRRAADCSTRSCSTVSHHAE
jgi:hypothetical protein